MGEDGKETNANNSKPVENGSPIQQKADRPRRYQQLKDLKNKMQERLRAYKKTEPDTDDIAQPRKYKRFDSMDEYRMEKFGKSLDSQVEIAQSNNDQEVTIGDSEEVKGTPAEGMDLDPRYRAIREELKQKWLEEHSGEDFLTEAGQNYQLGYVDPKEKHFPTIKTDADRLFREKYADDAQAYDAKEKTRIYDDPDRDPAIKITKEDILKATNLNSQVQNANSATGIDSYRNVWGQVNAMENLHGWNRFVQEFPEKASAYAANNLQITAALERLEESKRKETPGGETPLGRVQVDAIGDTTLINEHTTTGQTRPPELTLNNQPESTTPPDSKDETPQSKAQELETKTERKLINTEMAGTQATLLLGGTIGETIDRAKIEAIAKGEPVQTEKINKSSLAERDEYWNGEKSPHKDKTFNERMEIWTEQTNKFLSQFKGKPEAEFFKRMNIDLENENSAREIYDSYFVEGKGDVGLFASKIAENNTTEQIEENMAVIQKLGKMYGENSAKVAGQLAEGIKNAQTDTDLFIQSAQVELKKGTTMMGIDLIKILDQNISQSEKKSPVKDHDQQNEDDSKAEKNPTGGKLFQEALRESYANGGSGKDFKKDSWKNTGEISTQDDFLTFLPQSGVNRRYHEQGRGPNGYIFYEFGITDENTQLARGIQLTADAESLVEEPSGFKRVPTPFLWKVLETNPDSVGKRGITFDEAAYAEHPLQAKMYKPDNGLGSLIVEGYDYVGDTEFNLSWKQVTVDKETLVKMQQKTIEYLAQQVQDGQMPQEMLETAKGILNAHKASNTVEDKWQTDRGSGTSIEDPKLHSTFLQLTETWKPTGNIRQEGDLLVYDDEKYRKKGERREVELATIDQKSEDTGKKMLTEQAWDILKVVPGATDVGPYQLTLTEATSDAIQDRKGTWKKFIKPFTTDSQSLSKMQQMIRSYAEKQVTDGHMDSDVLKTIDGLIKYKHSTLRPVRVSDGDQGNVDYSLRYKRQTPVFVERPRERTLVEKVAEAANTSEPISNVDVTDSDISRYLGEKNLPFGARIKNLVIGFKGNTATMAGIVKVPIFGNVNFNLELANSSDGSGLVVTRHNVDTKSGTLRSKMGDLETSLRNINSFISEDINEQLRYHNPSLRVLGLSISPDGKFSAKVQNSQQVAA